MKIIDSHQHFWKYTQSEYDWIDDSMQVLKRDFLPQDLAAVYAENNIYGCIAVQARQNLKETNWLLELAEKNPFILGVVGWVDLVSENVDEQLEAFTESKSAVGVRHVLQDEPDDRYMLQDDFLRGISLIENYGLVYDILIFSRQLPYACDLVKQFPEQQFVLDHIAKPLIKDGILESWAGNIQKLAQYSNVSCKVSGMVTEADWNHWTVQDFGPYLDVVFKAFGPDRILFGSDWPVCTVAGQYKEILNIIKSYCNPLDVSDQIKVFADNTERIYSLK